MKLQMHSSDYNHNPSRSEFSFAAKGLDKKGGGVLWAREEAKKGPSLSMVRGSSGEVRFGKRWEEVGLLDHLRRLLFMVK